MKKLPVVEVQETFFYPPREATLQQWRDGAAESFVFCIRAWQLITHAPNGGTYPRLPKDFSKIDLTECGMFRPTEAVDQAYRKTILAAKVLKSPFIVFETPGAFTPTASHRKQLVSFFERVDRQGLQFVWDPQGIWEESEVLAICRDLSLVASVEPNDGEPSCYVRLGKARYTDDELLWIAESSQQSDVIYIFNSINMFREACRLQSMLAECCKTAC